MIRNFSGDGAGAPPPSTTEADIAREVASDGGDHDHDHELERRPRLRRRNFVFHSRG
jgi:hypothetical protein